MDENKSVRAILGEPKKAQKPVRRWFDPKKVRSLLKLPKPIEVVKPQPVAQYQVRRDEDQGFEPSWRVEPVNYTGRGIVYLFDCESDAEAFVKQKNEEMLKRK